MELYWFQIPVWWTTLVCFVICVGALPDTCSDITIPICLDLPYNKTIYPNLLRHLSQEEASLELYTYFPLLKANCSDDIQLFLCSMYVPVCNPLNHALPPCRSLCNSARKCEDIMQKFGYAWPESFRCEKFPIGDDEPCVLSPPERKTSTTPKPVLNRTSFSCPVQLKIPPDLDFKVYYDESQIFSNCGLPCHGFLLDFNQVNSVKKALGYLAGLSGFTSTIALFIFSVDKNRYPHPEKFIIYLLCSSLCLSVTFSIGYYSGDEIACSNPAPSTNGTENPKLLRQSTLNDWKCSATGMLFYFFLMSSCLWWLVLSITWVLSVGLQWTNEGIQSKSPYLHGFVWTTAAAQTLATLVFKLIEGDSLTGLCVVGVMNPNGLLMIIVPATLYMTLGLVLFALGLVMLFPIRKLMRQNGHRTNEMDKLGGKICLFATCYLLPSIIMLCCYLDDYSNTNKWIHAWERETCRNSSSGHQNSCSSYDSLLEMPVRPNTIPWKYVSILLTGIFTSIYVLFPEIKKLLNAFATHIRKTHQNSDTSRQTCSFDNRTQVSFF